jgi:hypothetical protein
VCCIQDRLGDASTSTTARYLAAKPEHIIDISTKASARCTEELQAPEQPLKLTAITGLMPQITVAKSWHANFHKSTFLHSCITLYRTGLGRQETGASHVLIAGGQSSRRSGQRAALQQNAGCDGIARHQPGTRED